MKINEGRKREKKKKEEKEEGKKKERKKKRIERKEEEEEEEKKKNNACGLCVMQHLATVRPFPSFGRLTPEFFNKFTLIGDTF